MRLFVGLDVSSFDMKVCFLNGDGEKLHSFSVSNDLPGATTLKEKLLQCVCLVQNESTESSNDFVHR